MRKPYLIVTNLISNFSIQITATVRQVLKHIDIGLRRRSKDHLDGQFFA
jgi:hypothetical protein